VQILVASDEPVTRTPLLRLLRAGGHRVVAAEDGEEAWRFLQQVHFSVVITDWVMPGLDGLELCRRIRARRGSPYPYVILLTATEGRSSFLQGMEAGADDLLSKPVDGEALRARLLLAERVVGLERAVDPLNRLLPICVYCEKIRDGNAGWLPIDRFLVGRSNRNLSHGICPECAVSRRLTLGASR
jgi:CheY-like chemotaxis protein